ncbi:DUF3800 domain-containing protein [uncultured Senegalimassilia sp.]|uniref:DUF3800 domain-containing protein n=1 Tax=uncultured Senegalimassilia sp. TaxID=1714350 RepID=UPI0027DEAA49|nr:DUF3800 domain-containing protein [uncultured Senegalimassilia sp.]
MNSNVAIRWVTSQASSAISMSAGASTTAKQQPETVYMYLDESGNFDFGPNGSEMFIMTCVVMNRPFRLSHVLMDYRYDCLENGVEIEKFHACEDTRDVRLGVYRRLAALGSGVRAYSVSIEKDQVPEDMRKASALYSEVFSWIVEEVYRNECGPDTAKAIVVTDSLPKQARKKEVEGPLKTFMKRVFQNNGIPYSLMHHCSSCDPNLQVADYFCWAVHRKLVKGFDWPYSVIEGFVKERGIASVKESGDA